ncbi:CBS domain-containing protein DDB_G0289609-like [Phalaenopsis equestris]|uniref:CBS domain-containing protein DDB_G0289609-like n=1 Tax=Phalaenopsis equestris TaxID=78828 RepID=UPI0009E331BA|nr:CBS domain-containing protein DDB_G0289609-like [Phalaenopsis equestris]
MANSCSLLTSLTSLSSPPAPAFLSRHRPGTVTVPRPSSLKVFFPSAGDFRPELDENPEAIISGEWTQNFSLLSYDDLLAYLRSQPPPSKNSQHVGSKTLLRDMMSKGIRTARAEQSLGEIAGCFEFVSGLPVVDDDLRCVGVVCKNDLARANHELNSKVADIMSSPAITLTPEKTVKDAAALMLRMKIHRIPILNRQEQVIGMVTRGDISQALQGLSSP